MKRSKYTDEQILAIGNFPQLYPAVLGLPAVIGLLRDPVGAAHLSHSASRLRLPDAELTLDIQALKAVVAKKVSPIARREAVGWLQTLGTSVWRACRVVGLSTATWRYQRQTTATNAAILVQLQAHAAEQARFGYRRLHVLLARGVVNYERVNRLYRAAGLQVRRRRRKHLTRGAAAATESAARALVGGFHRRQAG